MTVAPSCPALPRPALPRPAPPCPALPRPALLHRLVSPVPTCPSCPSCMPADTFWKSVVQGAATHETLQLEHPPTLYYSSHCEGLEKQRPLRLTAGRAQQAADGGPASAQPALTAA